MKSRKSKTTVPSFGTFTETLINELTAAGKYGTAVNYRKSLGRFRTFLGTRGMSDVSVQKIDSVLIRDYNTFLYSCSVRRNSVSFYNRNLRSIYHQAIEKYELPDLRPFKDVYTGVDRTANRAITEKEIYLIMHIDTGDNHALTLARDLFTFSYLLRGMTFVDMAFLRKSDIKGDTLTYRRRKTQVLLRARLEPEAREIISRYRKETADSDYVFPILGDRTDEAAYSRYRSALTVYNRSLKTLASRAGIHTSLSSYVSRHSWASVAYRSDVPMSIISESLGHSSEQTTRIYLASIDQRRIDDVNHRMVGRIKKFGSCQEPNFVLR